MKILIAEFRVKNRRSLSIIFLILGIFLLNPFNTTAQKPVKNPSNEIADKQTAQQKKAEERAKIAAKQAYEFAHGGKFVNWADADTRREIIRRFETAADFWKAADKPREEFDALREVGDGYIYLKDFPAALKILNRQLSLARRIPDAFLEYGTLAITGNVYGAANEPRKSLEFYNQAQKILETDTLRRDLDANLRNTNFSDIELERYKNWRITPTENLFHRLEDILFIQMGDLYKKLGEPEKAVEFYLKSLTAAKSARSFGYGEIADRARRVALTLTNMKQLDRAAEFLNNEIGKAHAEQNYGLESELLELAAQLK